MCLNLVCKQVLKVKGLTFAIVTSSLAGLVECALQHQPLSGAGPGFTDVCADVICMTLTLMHNFVINFATFDASDVSGGGMKAKSAFCASLCLDSSTGHHHQLCFAAMFGYVFSNK